MLIFEPSYFKNFACLAGQCRTTCCKGWRIAFDKADYDTMRSKRLPAKIKESLRKCTKRTKGDEQFYAQFEMGAENSCPLLRDDLCSLQIDAGYEYLPKVCKNYPRQRFNFGGNSVYKGCESSCEATLYLLLNNRLTFEQRTATKYEEEIAKREYSKRNYGEFEKHFEIIRTLTIAILQNSAYSLENRLLLLGMATKALQPIWKEKNWAEIPNWLITWAPYATGNDLEEELLKFDGKYLYGIQNCAENLFKICAHNNADLSFIEHINKGAGLTVTKVENSEANGNIFSWDIDGSVLAKSTKQLNKLLKQYPYFMENIIVNHILNECFPLNCAKGFFDSFISICYSYALMRFTAIGYVGENGTIEDVIDGIVLISRILRHNSKKVEMMMESLRADGKDTLGHMAYIIRI